MKRFLLGLLVLACLPAAYAQEGSVLIGEVMTDPMGSDTGREYIELVNTGGTPVDISGWELDPDQLPYVVFPPGTSIAPGGAFVIYLRQTGSGSGLYTGASFGSTNMGNTKGSVALFRSGTHDASSLQDFLQWGAAGQTHATEAAATGLFDPPEVLPVLTEGQVYERFCGDATGCFRAGDPTPGTPWQTTPATPPETPPAPAPVLRLHAVSPQDATADVIEVLVADDGQGGTGTLLYDLALRVDSKSLSLEGLLVKTGDVIHVVLGTSLPEVSGNLVLRWEANTGLTATTEQIELLQKGQVVDGVCWFREPVAQDEVAPMAAFRLLWEGDCLPSTGFVQDVLLKRAGVSMSAGSWQIQPPAPPDPEVSCDLDPADIAITEIFPNPEGTDTGQEWVELTNRSDQELQLCDLALDDEEGGSAPFSLEGLVIPPRSRLVLADEDTKLVLGNTTDGVRLLKGDGQVLQEVVYTSAPSGKSYSRTE